MYSKKHTPLYIYTYIMYTNTYEYIKNIDLNDTETT